MPTATCAGRGWPGAELSKSNIRGLGKRACKINDTTSGTSHLARIMHHASRITHHASTHPRSNTSPTLALRFGMGPLAKYNVRSTMHGVAVGTYCIVQMECMPASHSLLHTFSFYHAILPTVFGNLRAPPGPTSTKTGVKAKVAPGMDALWVSRHAGENEPRSSSPKRPICLHLTRGRTFMVDYVPRVPSLYYKHGTRLGI